MSQQGHPTAQRRQRVRVGRDHAQVIQDDLRDRAARDEPLRKRVELLAIGQVTLPEQVHDLLEGGVGGQVLDGVAAVNELALDPVDGADRGRRRDDILERARGGLGRFLGLADGS